MLWGLEIVVRTFLLLFSADAVVGHSPLLLHETGYAKFHQVCNWIELILSSTYKIIDRNNCNLTEKLTNLQSITCLRI